MYYAISEPLKKTKKTAKSMRWQCRYPILLLYSPNKTGTATLKFLIPLDHFVLRVIYSPYKWFVLSPVVVVVACVTDWLGDRHSLLQRSAAQQYQHWALLSCWLVWHTCSSIHLCTNPLISWNAAHTWKEKSVDVLCLNQLPSQSFQSRTLLSYEHISTYILFFGVGVESF